MLDAALVVVNYRSADLACELLELVAADGLREVVVVDNASGDGSAAAIRSSHPWVRVMERTTNDGFAAGVNAGMAATSAPVVLVLNPDTRPRARALRRLVDHLAGHPRAGVAAPQLLYPDGTPQPGFYRRAPGLPTLFLELCLPAGAVAQRLPRLDWYRMTTDRVDDGTRVAHATGAALAIRRGAFTAAGPFDEGFFLYLEETEWQGRVARAGYEVHAVPSAKVEHSVRGGGDTALAPSPHFLRSARRYHELRGRPRALTDAVIVVALALSRVAARAEPFAVPAGRRTGGARAAAYDALWRARSA